jgi:hypothetical protein
MAFILLCFASKIEAIVVAIFASFFVAEITSWCASIFRQNRGVPLGDFTGFLILKKHLKKCKGSDVLMLFFKF